MKNVIAHGTDEAELITLLKEIDENTVTDSILKSGQRVDIAGFRTHGKFKDWKVAVSDSCYNYGPDWIKGTGVNSFFRNLMETQCETGLETNDDVHIIALKRVSPSRNWRGEFESFWHKIDFETICTGSKTGNYQFDEVKLIVNESDFRIMLESRLAIMKDDGTIFPIMPCSLKSLGRQILDTPGSITFFSYLDDLVPAAMVLAEKLSVIDEIRFICYRRPGKIYPIQEFIGERYILIKQHEFMEKLLNIISDNSPYDIRLWSISDMSTKVDIKLLESSSYYEKGLLVNIGNVHGNSITVTCYVKYKGEIICLSEKSISHDCRSIEKDLNNLCECLLIFNEFDVRFMKMVLTDKKVKASIDYLATLLKNKNHESFKRNAAFFCDQMEQPLVIWENLIHVLKDVSNKDKKNASKETYSIFLQLTDHIV